jgi:hypothetical protein
MSSRALFNFFAALILLALLALLALAGCAGQVQQEAGVALMAVPTIPTRAPEVVATPDGIVNQTYPTSLTQTFLDVSAGFQIPAEWQAEHANQYAIAYNGTDENALPRMGVMIMRRSASELDAPVNIANSNFTFYRDQSFYGAVDQWFYREILPAMATIVPTSDDLLPFQIGDDLAALRRFDADYDFWGRVEEHRLTQWQVVLPVEDTPYYVMFWAIAADEGWDDFEPDMLAMLQTLNVNGRPIPISDVLAAYAAL